MVDNPIWYVKVSEDSYGPYTSLQMQDFVNEGRVVKESLITHDLQEGFTPAGLHKGFAAALKAVADYKTVEDNPAEAASSDPAVFFIMAEINSGQAMKFLQSLQRLGKAQRIGDSVWMLRTTMNAKELKAFLGGTLSDQDRLLVVDVFNSEIGWHNIGADMDKRIRDIWTGKD